MEWLTKLSEIGLPTIIAVLVGLFGFLKGIETIYKWGKDKFLYFYNRKRNNDKLAEDVSSHETEITQLNNKLDKFIDSVQKQQETNDRYDRNIARTLLLQMYDKFREQNYVTIIQLEAFDELYASYDEKKGNGLIHKTVYPYVHSLEVR